MERSFRPEREDNSAPAVPDRDAFAPPRAVSVRVSLRPARRAVITPPRARRDVVPSRAPRRDRPRRRSTRRRVVDADDAIADASSSRAREGVGRVETPRIKRNPKPPTPSAWTSARKARRRSFTTSTRARSPGAARSRTASSRTPPANAAEQDPRDVARRRPRRGEERARGRQSDPPTPSRASA